MYMLDLLLSSDFLGFLYLLPKERLQFQVKKPPMKGKKCNGASKSIGFGILEIGQVSHGPAIANKVGKRWTLN
jgi:hypothetical protein